MKRRCLSILLVLCMVMALLPTTAWAADSDFTIENGTLSKYAGSSEDITIPNSVTNIGNSVFMGLFKVKSISIPNSVTSIGSGAFMGCYGLTNITIPDSVTNIGSGAFQNCSGLTSIIIPNSITSIENSVFMNCSGLLNVTIPNSVTEIGNSAFRDCSGLTSITIPNSVEHIWNYAFDGCKSLKNIVIPNSIIEIRSNAFYNCTSLNNISIPDNITRIFNATFYNCSSLSRVTIPNSVTVIDPWVFAYCTSLSNISIPESVTEIGNSTFRGCTSLTNLTIPSNVTEISHSTFYDCGSLTNVTIPINITKIGSDAFYNCSSLKDVYYSGSKVQWERISIDSSGNSSLTSATIHYNSTGPDDVGPDNMNLVYFLSSWDATTRTVQFGDTTLVSPDTYTVADSVDVSNINSLLNKYVLVTMEQGDSSLEYTITNIQPVESKIGIVSATGEHSLTIDGTTYPVREDYILGFYDGKEVLYHVYNGTIMGYDVLEEKTGTLEAWDEATGRVTIDNKEYPSNYISILPDNILLLIGKKVDYSVGESIDYSPIVKLKKQQDLLAGNHIVDIDWGEINGGQLNGSLTITVTFDQALDIEETNSSDGFMTLWRKTSDGWEGIRNIKSGAVDYWSVNTEQPEKLEITIDNQVMSTWNQKLTSIPCNVEICLSITPDTVVFENSGTKFQGIPIGEVSTRTNWGLNPDIDFLSFSNSRSGDYAGFASNRYELSDTVASILLSRAKKGSSAYHQIQKWFDKDWNGSCQGMVSVMALANAGLLDLHFWDTDAETCYKLSAPKDSSGTFGTQDLINYYLMLPDLEGFPRVASYKNWITNLAHGSNWDEVARAVVEKSGNFQISKRPLLLYLQFKQSTFDTSGKKKVSLATHAVLAYGYQESNEDFQITIYDPSCPDQDSSLQINKNDYSVVFEGGWNSESSEWLKRDYRCKVVSLGYTEAADLQQYKIRQPSVRQSLAELSNERQSTLYFNTNSNFKLTNAEGDYLLYQNGTVSGTMDVYSLDVVGIGADSGLGAEYRLTVAPSSSFSFDSISGASSFTVYQDNNYLGFETESEEASIKVVPGKSLTADQLKNSEYKVFSSINTGDGDLAIIKGDGTKSVTISYTDNGEIKLTADDISTPEVIVFDGIRTVDAEVDSEGVISTPTIKHYSISFNPNGGTIDISTTTTGVDGKLSNLPVPTRSGYTFDGWYTAISGGKKITTDYVFTSDTTVYAHWTKNGGNSSDSSSSGGSSSGGGSSSTSYSITAGNFAHGSVSVSPKSALKGAEVILIIQPDSGYTLESLVVKDTKGNTVELTKESNTKYTFTMPNSKVTIDAAFIEIEQQPSGQISFTDVSPNAYYYDAVVWAVEQGITSGTSATTFSSGAPCTRAQIVTFLWRAAGSPVMGGENPFTDVVSGSYYYEAVQWAVAQGITVGTSANTFSPDATCTRGQAVTFLYRYEKSPAVSGNNAFTDVSDNAYYTNAVQWAAMEGVTSGTSTTTFSPDATCTRGQIVTFLYRDMA